MTQVLKSLQSPENLAIWPILSLIIFFVFFLGLIWWIWKLDKKFVKNMSELPLVDDEKVQESKIEYSK